ncbi:MAG: hypothetical protein ACJAZB_001565, partial [Psychrosphaera sp.]
MLPAVAILKLGTDTSFERAALMESESPLYT